jgi:hypothetical protein
MFLNLKERRFLAQSSADHRQSAEHSLLIPEQQ